MFAVLSSPGPVARLWRLSLFADSFCYRDDAWASDANKQCGCKVPTMVLSETRGL
jgi:hypothetical protein